MRHLDISKEEAKIRAIVLSQLDERVNKFKVAIGMPGKEEAVILSIGTDDYMQVAPNVFDRRVLNRFDVKFDFEKPHIELLKTINFKTWHVIFVRAYKGGFFDRHKHSTEERIFPLRGCYTSVVEVEKGRSERFYFFPGDCQTIQANAWHTFEPLTDSFLLLKLRKQAQHETKNRSSDIRID